jgi:hypothetical protein
MRRSGALQDDLMAIWAEMPRSPGHAFHDPKNRSWASIVDSASLACQSRGESPWIQARGSAQRTAPEESEKGSGQDFPPVLQVRQLLRIFDQAAQEFGDGAKRRGNGLGMRGGDLDRRLSGMADPLGDGV